MENINVKFLLYVKCQEFPFLDASFIYYFSVSFSIAFNDWIDANIRLEVSQDYSDMIFFYLH